MTTRVPFLDLGAMSNEVAAEVEAGFAEVIRTGAFVGGPAVVAFEQQFARYTGRAHCIGLANGTDAIELALRALRVGRGDEVILPANTFVATAEAVVRAGAQVVLVDVDPVFGLIDPTGVEAAIGPRSSAIIPVHLYGQMAPMGQIHRIAAAHGLAVVEDAAQAQGARQEGRNIGTGSHIATTSFYPGKNLGAFGDGGAGVTDDDEIASRVRLLANHGSPRKYHHEIVGFNSRLDTLQAVVLAAKLRRLEGWNGGRREAADRYSELLQDLDGVSLPMTAVGNLHVWHLYVVRLAESRRDFVAARLADRGVATGIHYPAPVHLLPAFAYLGFGPGSFPASEGAAAEILSLPMFPTLTSTAQEWVAKQLRESIAPQFDERSA